MKTIELETYKLTIATDNTGNPAAYVNGSEESSASGAEAIYASFLQDARDAGKEDELYEGVEG